MNSVFLWLLSIFPLRKGGQMCHVDKQCQKGEIFILWTLELILEKKSLERRIQICVPLQPVQCLHCLEWRRKAGVLASLPPLELYSLFHIEKMTFLCQQRPARISGTRSVASTVAQGIFVWVGFVLFRKQQSTGCLSVQGRTVFIKFVIKLVSTVEVARVPWCLLPIHWCQNVRSIYSKFNLLTCSQVFLKQPQGFNMGPRLPRRISCNASFITETGGFAKQILQ